jgi:agmatinase
VPSSEGIGVPTNGSFARALVEENPEMTFVTVGLRGYLRAAQPVLSGHHNLIPAADVIRTGSDTLRSSLPETMPCYVSFDVDFLDPSVAPNTNVPVPGGPWFGQVCDILTAVGAQRRVIGIDIVELNPERDPYARSAFAAVNLVVALLGRCVQISAESRTP